MTSYLVAPPCFQSRMDFMDSMEKASIDYSREPEGYFIFLREGQQQIWEQIRLQFNTVVYEEDPVVPFGT